MNEIALISDIHGNLPALEAVEADIKSRGISSVYCLGDMCGRGPNGRDAIAWCRQNCEVVILGNWDEHVMLGRAGEYSNEVAEEQKNYLKTLAFTHKLWISGRRIHFLHGRPMCKDIIWDFSSEEEMLRLFSVVEDEYAPDIVAYADIHRQFKKDFKDDTRILFNIGSVGCSYCTPTACYAILRGILNSREKAPVSIEFVSVPYDNQKAVENMLKADWFYAREAYTKEVTLGKWQKY
ncbi:metallophosphoesterase [Eubacteriales bacterium OttesenSCG-928-G02]|nr:metallophosphoesterase [Eubacteriales bacterium OttesenSCG-928-G02]